MAELMIIKHLVLKKSKHFDTTNAKYTNINKQKLYICHKNNNIEINNQNSAFFYNILREKKNRKIMDRNILEQNFCNQLGQYRLGKDIYHANKKSTHYKTG